jgi:hypothetical protein
MIDPKLLTPENGFGQDAICIFSLYTQQEDGEAWQEHIGRITWVDGKCCVVEWPGGFWRVEDVAINWVTVLTGPMAIWNFAPDWAEWCIDWGESIEWGSDGVPVGSGAPVYRPSWAKEAK